MRHPCRLSVLALVAALWGCKGRPSEISSPLQAEPSPDQFFEEVELPWAGQALVHDAGVSGEFHFPEIMGSGAAMLDFDNDGDLDLFLVQGAPGGATGGASRRSDALLRNDSTVDGVPSFVDITDTAGVPIMDFGMGVATGDLDRDGNVDIYRTSWGGNRLLRNRGDGTFEDWSDAVEAAVDRWSTSAALVDVDNDGWLDIYVANYVDFRLENHVPCQQASGYREYCGPQAYRAEPDRLLVNQGLGEDGRLRFLDATRTSGLLEHPSAALGVLSLDIDADGRAELLVANDQQENTLWRRLDSGALIDVAMTSGVAVNGEGTSEASMGVASGDYDMDGDEDLFLTHLRTETNTLYTQRGEWAFEDRTHRLGLAVPSVAMTGFGALFFDLENDGDLDLAVVNGTVRGEEESGEALEGRGRYAQRNQLFVLADGGYREVGAEKAGGGFRHEAVSRGLASGDIDNDGDIDLLVTNNNGSPQLLPNRAGGPTWMGLGLYRASGSDYLGTRVELWLGTEGYRLARVRTDGSYCSARDPRAVFGLGRTTGVPVARIHWPDGLVTSMRGLHPGKYTRVSR